jgi:DNA sulfur modification protein DndD
MIFQELVLVDVGPFAGEQRIPLEPKSPEKPVILFGGLNGAGKTTVLEALLLALYGGLTPGSARRASSYERYLRNLINRDAPHSRGAMVELTFRAVHDGAWHTFQVRRRWWAAGERMREMVEVSRDGAPDMVLTEAWADHIEAIAPRGVANLFFFDGEQVEAFADLDVAKELVRTAIGGLLGLDLVDRLQDDLAVLERRKRTEAAQSAEERQSIEARQAALESLQRREMDARQAVDEAERQVTLAQRDVDQAAQRLAREGGARFHERDELNNRLKDAVATHRHSQTGLVEALGGQGPLLLVEPLLEQTIAQATAEQRQFDNQTLADLLSDRDAALLVLLRNEKAAAGTQQAVAKFLTDDLAHRKAGDGVPTVLGIDSQTLGTGQRLLAGDLSDEREHLRQRVNELAAAQAAVDDAERAVASIPADDAVAPSVEAHQTANYALAETRAQLDAARRAHQEATNLCRVAKVNVDRETKEANAAILQSEDAQRTVEHAIEARATLAKLRSAATQRHTQRIEALIFDSLQTLLRKDKLISEVRIDPETCAMELLAPDGRPVRPRALSAGERQLLAVSLLAGLARASGRLLPVVIDTPLGRLDQDHRKRLIERYLPRASHQVLVLSTDTEITPDVLHRLGDSVSHMIKLDHNQSTGATVVREGYFTNTAETQSNQEQA